MLVFPSRWYGTNPAEFQSLYICVRRRSKWTKRLSKFQPVKAKSRRHTLSPYCFNQATTASKFCVKINQYLLYNAFSIKSFTEVWKTDLARLVKFLPASILTLISLAKQIQILPTESSNVCMIRQKVSRNQFGFSYKPCAVRFFFEKFCRLRLKV